MDCQENPATSNPVPRSTPSIVRERLTSRMDPRLAKVRSDHPVGDLDVVSGLGA